MNQKKAKAMRKQARLSAEVEGVQKENKYEVLPNNKRPWLPGQVVLSDCERALYRQIKKFNKFKKNSGSTVKYPE